MTAERDIPARYEAKYLISEATARAVAHAVQPICSPDEHASGNGSYIINSLYFDSRNLAFYHDTKLRQYSRCKPRVRYYGTSANGHLWLELKHKHNGVTWKTRQRIDRDRWPDILVAGESTATSDAPHQKTRTFTSLVARMQAKPVLHVRYVREAYASDLDEYARITFDRRLSYQPARGSLDLGGDDDMVFYDDPVSSEYEPAESPVILEIKTELKVPRWVIALVRRFELRRRGFSKYCYGIDHASSEKCAGARVSAYGRANTLSFRLPVREPHRSDLRGADGEPLPVTDSSAWRMDAQDVGRANVGGAFEHPPALSAPSKGVNRFWPWLP